MSAKSERALGPIHWLYGLSDYLEYAGEHDAKKLVDFIIKLSYAEDPIFKLQETGSIHEFVFWLTKFTEDVEILTLIQKYTRDGHDTGVLPDLFSRGQVQSKIWLATELCKIKKDFTNIHILASWFGQLTRYLDIAGITYERARLIDMDPIACKVSDTIFNFDKIENFKVKSINTDILNLDLSTTGITCTIEAGKLYDEKLESQLIINSSSEHMSDEWFFKIKFKEMQTNPIIVIQNNNLFDVPDHVNCVHSINHMKKKFPMSEIYFEGELQLQGYKRFMLIGRLH